jgi:hypothetical protein
MMKWDIGMGRVRSSCKCLDGRIILVGLVTGVCDTVEIYLKETRNVDS